MSETGPPYYLEARWNQYLRELFDEPDRSAVLEWLKRHSGESRVILVGAGFTRNAETPSCINIPLWKEQSEALRRELGLPDNAEFTDLELPDLYRQQHPAGHPRDLSTVLKGLVPNDLLKPGKAHDALWRSLPIAVITTNYLDTTLEKSRPPRYRRVVRDQDLAPTWGRDGLCPLIYFHGHRTYPETWVAGRRDYERIEQTRPILVAKVRQLVAEYPVLIVGYSLSDPDFHSIYRSTTESMKNHHPGALAIMLPVGDDKKRERDLANEYWKTKRLSIVSFCGDLSQDWDAAYERFFELTLNPKEHYQFSQILETPKCEADIPECFAKNLRIGRSALDCERGDEPQILRSDDSRRRAWRDVLQRSVLPKMCETAEEKAAQANRAAHARGPRTHGQQHEPTVSEPPLFDEERWLSSSEEWHAKTRTLTQHLRANSSELWILEQLVGETGRRAEARTLAWNWIRFGLERDLHYLAGSERGLLAALGLLCDGDEQRIETWTLLASSEKDLLEAAGIQSVPAAPSKRKSRTSEDLARARGHLLLGERSNARAACLKVLANLSVKTLNTFEEQLQGFFAAQGLLEAQDPFEFGEELVRVEALREGYRSAHKVERWVSRIRQLTSSISTQRERRSPNGYESRGFSWSVAPRELHDELEKAERLGCPPFWLRDNLLAPLLGEIPDARIELELRLRYLVKDTGNWASSAIERGEFEVNRADPFRRHYSLDRKTRRRGQQIVSGHICQIPNPTYAANLDTLKQAHELICVQDLDAAILGSSKARAIDRMDDPRFGLLCAVAHLTEWNRIRDPLMGLLREERGRDYFEIHRLLPSWPWEQWVRCDDFLANGGLDALRILCSTAPERTGSDSTGGSVFASNVGYVLSNLLHLDRENLELIRLAKSWLIQAAKRVESETTLLLPAVTLLGLLQTGGQTAGAFAQFARDHHQSLLKQQRMHFDLLLQAARAPEGSPMQKWGQQELYSWGETHTGKVDRAEARRFHRSWEISSEAAALVFLIERYPKLRKKCRRRLFDLMDVSWNVLSTLGSVLEPMYWDDDWERLRSVLALGGRRRDPHTWNLERFALTMAVTFDGLPKVKPLHPECQFLYRAALDAMSHHEERVANSATYAALLSAPFLVDAADQNMAALAIVSAADDVRTSVAHGAAFAAGYWQGLDLASPILREAGEKAWQMLSDDPAAIIHRQYRFGLAKGRFGRGSVAPQAS